ncbi:MULTISPECIES: FkbM family methyltransferase [unclassified Anabaena]|uniref:FkbM family methyltransferase n=1 Tax=unclassified Anabaena TaxID=2619674 RepID=UPI0039C6D06C
MRLTIENYINTPSPIEHELKELFDTMSEIIIFDIGSCEGEDSIKYSRLFPNSKVYAFEPLPNNLSLLYANLKEYSTNNVEVLPIALSNEKGKALFYVSSGQPENLPKTDDWNFGNKSSSLLPPDKHIEYAPWLTFNQVIQVDTDTLQNFCINYEIKCIDFIHMDVQGAELKVLEGAADFLNNIKSIWLEVESISLYEDQPLKVDIENFMQRHGFCKIKDTVGDIAGDQLYVNSKYFHKKQINKYLYINLFFIFKNRVRIIIKHIFKGLQKLLRL